MSSTLVIHAHPRPGHSIVTQELRRTLESVDELSVRALYELYPDFDIDVSSEQQALEQADLVIWLAPVHWYSVPALMKHWFDQVLAHGWAYGRGGNALQGKRVWWVASAGGAVPAYSVGGSHGRPFADFVAPVEHMARYCGMQWLPPFVVHAGHAADADTRRATREALLQQLRQHQGQAQLAARGAAA